MKSLEANDNDDEIEDNVQKLIDETRLGFDGNILAAYDFFTYKLSY